MKRHTITLEATGRALSVASYVEGIRLAKAEPLMMFRHGLTTWWPCAGSTIMYQFRQGCHERQSARAAAQPIEHLPKHERYLRLLRERTDKWAQMTMPTDLRRDANPRIVGEQADGERRLYVRMARQDVQRALRAGSAS